MLTIISTPIGNLGDLSLRAAKAISQSDILLSEDTRSAFKLLDYIAQEYKLTKEADLKVISYYREKEFQKLPEVMGYLEAGKTVTLITDAGTPLIADPGSLLVQTCVKKGYEIDVIPGASALTTILPYDDSGRGNVLFVGFLPKKKSDCIRTLERAVLATSTMKDTKVVFYESPLRIQATLQIIDELFPDATVLIGRELTKKFQEIIRGNASELKTREYKGELSVILHIPTK